MHLSRTMRLTILGFSLLPVGCAGGKGENIDEIEAPYAGPLTSTNTNGGDNGLGTDFFHDNKGELYAVAKTELDPDLGEEPNAAVLELIDSEGGRKAFEYMVDCGVAFGTTVSYTDEDAVTWDYPGNGLLSTTAGWMADPLDDDATNDVFACMLAHLNPSTTPVPLVVSGAAVAPLQAGKNIDPSQYTFQEALWTARVASGSYIFNVWPLGDLVDACSDASTGVEPHVFTRVCGTLDGVSCGVNIRSDFTSACQGANGQFTCDGQRALQTWLRPCDVETLYPSCTQLPLCTQP